MTFEGKDGTRTRGRQIESIERKSKTIVFPPQQSQSFNDVTEL